MAHEVADTRTCVLCKQEKSVKQFFKRGKASGGFSPDCRACRKQTQDRNHKYESALERPGSILSRYRNRVK